MGVPGIVNKSPSLAPRPLKQSCIKHSQSKNNHGESLSVYTCTTLSRHPCDAMQKTSIRT
jgi:hypothetical protein